jgi:hypothetical protein
MTDTPRPPRGYSWPPFQPGHTLSLVHGADSPRTIEARAVIVRQELLAVCPWLDPDKDVIAVARFLRAEARALMLHEYVTSRPVEKIPLRAFEQATAADRLAAQLGSILGLDPTGRARLQQTVASTEVTLAELAEQGRQTSGYRAVSGPAASDTTTATEGDK